MDEELIFKALADESRRTLLDALFTKNGQTLKELVAHLNMTLGPDQGMTRYGVMKHLAVLEEAGLLTTHKVGRSKHHYLNPVPIQLVYDRWVSKYAQPWAQSLADLKYTLEAAPTMSDKPAYILQTFIRTTPAQLWQALTDGDFTRQYYMGTRVVSDWQHGSDYAYLYDNDEPMISGTVIECDPPKRLVTTFNPLWVPAEQRPQETHVTFTIEQRGDSCLLTIVHSQWPTAAPFMPEGVHEGWAQILSGLKTLLETGEVLPID